MQTSVGRQGEAWITSARDRTIGIGMTDVAMRTRRDLVDVTVTDSRRVTGCKIVERQDWGCLFPWSSSLFFLICVLIPKDRCRFLTVQTDASRELSFYLEIPKHRAMQKSFNLKDFFSIPHPIENVYHRSCIIDTKLLHQRHAKSPNAQTSSSPPLGIIIPKSRSSQA